MFWVALLAVQVWIADESVKVRPDARPPALAQAPRIRLAAAGGECVGAQIVVRGPVRGLKATSTLDLYRVATITLTQPSGPDGATGEWPDALIPARDVLFGEERRAFPVDVAEGRAQAIFVEACVARGAAKARLASVVKLTWDGGEAEVPVDLRRRGFDLPATPPLATAFGFSGYSAAKGHGRDPDANRELTRAYDRIALRRGITLFGGTQDAPRMRNGKIDWTAYDEEVGPFIDRWTAVELREPSRLSRDERRSYRRQWVEHFRKRGWLDKLFRYVYDEPAEKDFPKVEQLAREYREDVPEVRRLVTTRPSPKLPSVDLFAPLINFGAVPRMWWYQSCMSHGCEPSTHESFRGWPSYMIDAPATAARAMGTLAFVNDVAGELYFDTVYAYDSMDPWKSQWAFAGNGDGTLYYPGTPARIGGTHDVPVESLRIVQIARGLADHAYLSLCAQLGDPALAKAEARAVAPGVRSWSRDPRAYAQMREHLAARIETLLTGRKLGSR
ncbi:MAG: glycoside hydrolase domain-containing protein [Myxococcales bacterium]|nr:DUF4091 domain-containing protein [Myxococcales bacterium]